MRESSLYTRGMSLETTDQSERKASRAGAPAVPGLLLVFAGTRPRLAAIPVGDDARVLGRGELDGIQLDHKSLSRRHAMVEYVADRFVVRDLSSRNGTFLDGLRIDEAEARPGAVLRLGETLFLLCADVSLFQGAAMDLSAEMVMGPRLQRVWGEIARAAGEGGCLHLVGETGSGKELAARQFHRASGRQSEPFIAVNCATIPPLIAERLLFGARRGAYSGADTDADGYLQAAHGGTLFLDEVADLSLEVQAKLLRVIESREVLQLGATRARPVDLRLCSATHRDLRDEAAAGRFRQDLYYRIGRPSTVVPPLRARPEDLPWLVQWLLGKQSQPLELHVSFVEAVLTRPWPGNVRELATEVATAANSARAEGHTQLEEQHLPSTAGQPLGGAAVRDATAPRTPLRTIPEVAPEDRPPGPELPPRVRATLEVLMTGASDKQIASELGISQHTVHQYVKALFKAYNVDSRAKLVAQLLRKS